MANETFSLIDSVYGKQQSVSTSDAPVPLLGQDQRTLYDQKLVQWLESVGLQSDPFDARYLDAGSDPNLHAYLIGHRAFDAIWQANPAFVFAPAGGGKTSFRVRLTRACRVGQDGRRIFPVVYKMQQIPTTKWPASLSDHLRPINRMIGAEILMTLVAHPQKFFNLSADAQKELCELLYANLPGELSNLLAQVEDRGDITPLVASFDPSADNLFAPPDSDDVRQLCRDLLAWKERVVAVTMVPTAQDLYPHFQQLIALIQTVLGYEEVYLLVDGVDAYVEYVQRPAWAVQALQPLLQEMAAWCGQKIYIKYFLPEELRPQLNFEKILPFGAILNPCLVHIHWTREMLLQLVQERLFVASQGRYNSLDAICVPALRGVQYRLVDEVKPLPREILVLAGRILTEHIRRTENPGLLEPTDFQQAVDWYRETSA
ncbi:MAG: hypothetical protein KDE53_31705 [Caldilineaceae bacterium]|nr:hypothetical protein [Caldilineaceae bacterium]